MATLRDRPAYLHQPKGNVGETDRAERWVPPSDSEFVRQSWQFVDDKEAEGYCPAHPHECRLVLSNLDEPEYQVDQKQAREHDHDVRPAEIPEEPQIDHGKSQTAG